MKKTLSTGVALLACCFASSVFAGYEGHEKGKMLEKADYNKDGKLDKQEFLQFHAEREKNKPSPEEMFAKRDSNNDGFITKDEMKHCKGECKKDKRESVK